MSGTESDYFKHIGDADSQESAAFKDANLNFNDDDDAPHLEGEAEMEEVAAPVEDLVQPAGDEGHIEDPVQAAGSEPLPPAPNPTDRQIFEAAKDLIKNIPDMTAVTQGEVRKQLAIKLGLGADGLDKKSAELAVMLQCAIDGTDYAPLGGAPASPTYKQAQTAIIGLKVTKLPKPQYVPSTPSVAGIEDLPLRSINEATMVKAMVDVIPACPAVLDEAIIQQCVVDGAYETLPPVLQPPPGAISANHFTQVAIIRRADGLHDIVKFITFESQVTKVVALTHKTGNLHFVNYGGNIKQGKKVFLYLFSQLGGVQIRHWTLTGDGTIGFSKAWALKA